MSSDWVVLSADASTTETRLRIFIIPGRVLVRAAERRIRTSFPYARVTIPALWGYTASVGSVLSGTTA